MAQEIARVLSDLSQIEWAKGKRIVFEPSSYRHRQVIECMPGRPFKARFANGEFSYIAYWELVRGDGSWNKQGVNLIPVLPGEPKRYLMVVEQRAPMGQYQRDIRRTLELSSGELDLRKFGPNSSLEFPGGAVEAGETVVLAGLKELAQETGIPEQPGILYINPHPIFPFVCDLAHVNYMGAIFLSSSEFAKQVQNDGGLRVLALTAGEIERNIGNGVFCSMNAGLGMWYWFERTVQILRFAASDWRSPHPLIPKSLRAYEVKVSIPN